MKIGIIREGKIPPDSRVPLIPEQCAEIVRDYPVDIVVEPFPGRCYPDELFRRRGIPLSDDLSDCDILLGVKEVPVGQLIPEKTYFFFSHTIKEQPYNRTLLRAILEKNIRLVDYEVLTDERGKRLIAFGRFAGMVGAHNGILAYGRRTGKFSLPRMKDCLDYAEAKMLYKKVKLPPMKIVLTGTGRVGQGAADVLEDMGIRRVTPGEFLKQEFQEAVFTQLSPLHYAARKDGGTFSKKDFYRHPELFKSIFEPYYRTADVMINGIYWDKNAPAFFSKAEMRRKDFHIQVIADVTCDIAPLASVPSTLRASTIADPIYGYGPEEEAETEPYQPHSIDVMAIDNLPNELPRDASKAFGRQFISCILPELLKEKSAMIERATIAENGRLGAHFQYLEGYVKGEAVNEGVRD
ncbi:MAG: alanine dehydrogenase [Phaeodactylibacter sp.]|nr:alanine dehydrogenase [Phaeodactylibacter sp.]MCB9286772.1 alanine dehydrogenase [Lewinellaceae bacterium]